MAAKTLIEKLQIKSGQFIAFLNAPAGYPEELGELPPGVALTAGPEGTFDLVLLFVTVSAEMSVFGHRAMSMVKDKGLLWVAYPKGGSGVETDLNRDILWKMANTAGWRPVAQIAIDDTWSAIRLVPAEQQGIQDIVEAQYAGKKAGLRPIYNRLIQVAQGLGDDVKLTPRKSYVALVRKKQFALIQPSTTTRVDLGLKLPGAAVSERLQDASGFGSGSITHKVALASVEDVDQQILDWLHMAYESVA